LVRAQSADEALLALVQFDFIAIVLDVQLPQMTGFELAQLIKRRKRTQHIPIIFLTAYFQDDKDVLSGYDVGAVDYLTKPVDPRILQSKINVFVDLFRTHRALVMSNRALEQEIVEHQQAQLALTRLAEIVECSSDPIFSKTLEGIITTWNRAAERLLGYTAAEIVGQPVSILIPADRAEENRQIKETLKRGQSVGTVETQRLRKDGSRVDVSLTLSPIRDIAGNITGYSAIVRDISERRRLEAEVFQASEREQHRIAQDLHDGLGQKLAGISCLSNLLQKDLETLASPHAATAAKISGLLDLAVAESRTLARGLHPIAPEPNGLMAALESLAASATDLFQVSCRFECPDPVLVKDYDLATHLYRIAQEAVSNSIKHGRAHRIEIGLHSTPGQMVLRVCNNGAGMETVQKLMQQEKGIGMRIMKYRANNIGGTLACHNNDQGGIDVVCTLSLTGEPEHEATKRSCESS
jgi:PAS domain S-box-containing protein